MNNRGEKGITLVALVITIIVLLILATVSILALTGQNGLFTRAKEAKNNTIDAQKAEDYTVNDANNGYLHWINNALYNE